MQSISSLFKSEEIMSIDRLGLSTNQAKHCENSFVFIVHTFSGPNKKAWEMKHKQCVASLI